MKFGACIDTLYTELPWEARFAAAKGDGFDCVEFWDWRRLDLKETRRAAVDAGIAISGFNGDADFSPIDPSHRARYIEELKRSLDAANALGAPSVTVHSNALGEGGVVVDRCEGLSDTVKLCSLYETLREAAAAAEAAGVNLNLEALNVYTDHAGNFLKTTRMSAELCRLVGSPRLRILYDAYHMQINEGRICGNLEKSIDVLGHVHIADAPGRHEPYTGEINYENVFRCLMRLGYKGAVGCELFPAKDTPTAAAAIMRARRAAGA